MLDLKGVIPALLTPSDDEGNPDWAPLGRLVDFLLDRGVRGFFVGGTTGEGFFLSAEERKVLLEKVLETVAGRAPVIAHVGGMNFREVRGLAKHAGTAGADAISSVVPFYYAYSLDEIADYYQAISDASDLPTLIYFMTQAGNKMVDPRAFAEAVLRVDRLYGLKYTDEDFFRLQCLKQLSDGRLRFFGGSDAVAMLALTMGADGMIGSNYNVLPEVWVAIYEAFEARDMELAMALQDRLTHHMRILKQVPPLCRAKGLMKLRGMDIGEPRRPARPVSDAQMEILRGALDGIRADPMFEIVD